ncbi:MAG: PAS domain-containing protein [Rhizobiales bacterium]|nr:PAS domain-containing protein [Hyphomicrobiales bacterium]
MLWPFTRQDTGNTTKLRDDSAAERRRLADFVLAFPDPVMVLDRNGTVIIANEPVRGLLDVDPLNQHLSSSIRAPAVLDAVTAALSGHPPSRVEYEVRVPLPRHFDIYVSPIPALSSAEPAVLIVLKDLTREQQIERMRADFVANASHELRTPLASLSGFIETLMGAAKNDAVAREKFLETMRSQADRMKRLIDDLLSLSRIEMNVHLRPSGTVDLAQIARHVADIMSGMAKSEGCELRLDLPKPLMVTGDRDELVQVVQNLVENALKYASTGRVIDIEGRRDDGHVELSVRDHGPGIAAEHMPRLTERFYRVSVQESRSRGGTGLGLAIVKHILIRHRGRLKVASELGKGSTFAIRLPMHK